MNARPTTATSKVDFPSKKPRVARSVRRSGSAPIRELVPATEESSAAEGPTLSRVASSTSAEQVPEGAEGAAPVTDAVLLVAG